MVGESTPRSDLEDSAPHSHKRKKLGSWLKLANQELESVQGICTSTSILVEATKRKVAEDYYHSLTKECLWAEHLTSLPKMGVVSL